MQPSLRYAVFTLPEQNFGMGSSNRVHTVAYTKLPSRQSWLHTIVNDPTPSGVAVHECDNTIPNGAPLWPVVGCWI